MLLSYIFGAVPKWSQSTFPETFAGTGAKHYAGHVITAFTDEESWCQLKPVTGLSSTSRKGSNKLSVFHRRLICSRTNWYGQGFLETAWWLFTAVWTRLFQNKDYHQWICIFQLWRESSASYLPGPAVSQSLLSLFLMVLFLELTIILMFVYISKWCSSQLKEVTWCCVEHLWKRREGSEQFWHKSGSTYMRKRMQGIFPHFTSCKGTLTSVSRAVYQYFISLYMIQNVNKGTGKIWNVHNLVLC